MAAPEISEFDPHDLGALEAKAGHQTLLIEREGVDAAMYRFSCRFHGCVLWVFDWFVCFCVLKWVEVRAQNCTPTLNQM
jgi:hypothetical protein